MSGKAELSEGDLKKQTPPNACDARQIGNHQDLSFGCHQTTQAPLKITINSEDYGDEMGKKNEHPDTPLAKGRG